MTPFDDLTAFVAGQCYFNPDIDLEMLVKKYCCVYGEAAGKMLKAINWYRVIVKKNEPKKVGGKEYGCGVYDRASTEWTKFKIKPVEPNDEKYHWYHLGEAHIGNNSLFYLPEESWSISMYLSRFFVNSDGLVDNNWYDFWVNVKFAGPDYVPGSSKTNGVYVSRIIMRRTPKEQQR